MGPFVRIGLRYLGGYLAARGWLAQTDTDLFDDPDLVAALSYGGAMLCALIGEGWYALARKMGWAK